MGSVIRSWCPSPEAAGNDGRSAGELASEFRLLWIIDRVRSGGISLGRGAVLAGMDRWSFMRAMDEHGVPVIGYSVEDLKKDVYLGSVGQLTAPRPVRRVVVP